MAGTDVLIPIHHIHIFVAQLLLLFSQNFGFLVPPCYNPSYDTATDNLKYLTFIFKKKKKKLLKRAYSSFDPAQKLWPKIYLLSPKNRPHNPIKVYYQDSFKNFINFQMIETTLSKIIPHIWRTLLSTSKEEKRFGFCPFPLSSFKPSGNDSFFKQKFFYDRYR